MSFGSARLTDGLAKAVPSYAAFVAAETGRATGGALAWGIAFGAFTTTIYRSTAAAFDGTMFGSPWQRSYAGASPARLAQHAFPNSTVANAYTAAGRMVVFSNTYQGDGAVSGFSRNGFSSSSSELEGTGRCTDFRYYDDVLGPVKMNPYAGTGPTPYTLGT